MKIIFSQWTIDKPGNSSIFKELAALSNFFVKSHGYKTVLYTDAKGYDAYKNIEYDEFRELPENILNSFPHVGWSLGKLLAVSLIKEPFLHFDFDLFLTRPLDKKFLEKDILFSYQEIWMDYVLKKSCHIIKKKPDILNDYNSLYRSYNCSIFGGNNFEAFNDASKYVIEFAIEHKNYLNDIVSSQDLLKDKGLVSNYMYFAMILEQLWLPEILKLKKHNIETILHDDEIAKVESMDFSTEIDLNKKSDEENYLSKYKYLFLEYQNIIHDIAKAQGITHYLNNTKYQYKDKIINLAKSKNLKY